MVMSFGHRRAALSLRQSGNPFLWLLGLQYFTFFFFNLWHVCRAKSSAVRLPKG